MYTSFQHDETAPAALWAMGYHNVMWGSDYPHLEGTFGHTQKTLHELFDGVDPATIRTASRAAPSRSCSRASATRPPDRRRRASGDGIHRHHTGLDVTVTRRACVALDNRYVDPFTLAGEWAAIRGRTAMAKVLTARESRAQGAVAPGVARRTSRRSP